MKKTAHLLSSSIALLFVSILLLMGCESNQQSQNMNNPQGATTTSSPPQSEGNSLFKTFGRLYNIAGNVGKQMKDPEGYERERQHRENEELRQAYLKRIADSNRPLTQEDIAILQQFQNQQYQQQYLNHLQRMEDLKKQEIENQKFESMRREIREGMPIYVIPDGRGGYIID